jgi:nucleotide-binding universal stress UspA family protein
MTVIPGHVRASGVPTWTEILSSARGQSTGVLVDYAKDNEMDLLVVGSRGVGELETVSFGSVSQKVSPPAGCSVLIVR